jgi:hypothetical protein
MLHDMLAPAVPPLALVQQLKQWVADDGRRGPSGQPLGEGLCLPEGLRMVLEGFDM